MADCRELALRAAPPSLTLPDSAHARSISNYPVTRASPGLRHVRDGLQRAGQWGGLRGRSRS
jgi:hypothetical protein